MNRLPTLGSEGADGSLAEPRSARRPRPPGRPRTRKICAFGLLLGLVLLSSTLAASGAPPVADPYWEALLPGEAPDAVHAPPVLQKKLARKQQQAASPEKRYDKPSEAQRFFLLKRSPTPGQPLPVERYLDALQHMRRMPRHSTRAGGLVPPAAGPSEPSGASAPGASASSASAALGAWTALGPGNIGGRTRAILIDPTSPATMYAAGVAGGVWKSLDGGASWTPLADLIANLAVNALAMDPLSTNVIYAGTGEGYFNIDGVRGAGIFKTTDGGANWTHLATTSTPDFYYVNKVVVSASNTQRVYAATRTGVWRSLDGGANWTQVLSTGVSGGCLDLVIRNDMAVDYLFASCGTFQQATIYRNTDAAGVGSWASVYTEAGMGRTSLALAPSNQAVVYAVAASIVAGTFQDGLLAVFRSTSGGDPGTWLPRVRNTSPTKLNTVLLTNPVFAFYHDCHFAPPAPNQYYNQGWYDNVIAVDPADSNRVWVGGIDLFRSDDGGANWGLASHWWADSSNGHYAHADQHAIVFHPQYNGTSNKTMFVGNDGGVFRTSDARAATATGSSAPCDTSNGSVVWTELNNGYGVTQFYHGLPYPGGATYFGGTQDNGTVRGTDGAGVDGWTEILGGDGGYVAIDPGNPNVLYAEYTGLSIQKSTNGGASFSDATNGIGEPDSHFLFISPFTMDPSNAQRLWTGGYFLWRTSNGASSWSQASAITAGQESVSAIAVAPTDANRMLAGMSDGFIHRTDIGLTSTGSTDWPVTQPRTGYVSWVTFDPTNATIAYATYSTFGGTHVWKSLDSGASWTGIDGSGATAIPDIPVHSIVVDPTTPSRLYVGTDLGVFVSRDGGGSWAVENTGFANVITEALAAGNWGATPSIFAFTHGRGAWRVASADTDNPVPTIGSLSPPSATAGGAGFPLTVTGTGFVPTSLVRWNGSDRVTSYTSATQLQATIPASDIASPGTAQVTVFNPAPGGGVSGPAAFPISGPPPTITTTSPLPGGTVGTAYSQSFQATGGATPYTWSQVSGTLPPGLALSAAGLLGGTPTASGSFSFRVRVTGADAQFSEQDFSLAIAPAPSPIVIDNAGAGVQDPAGGRTFTGTWCVSASSGAFGADSLYSCGSGTDTYRWTPAIPTAGAYDVYVWWTAHANRSTTVPITVQHAGGTTTKTFNEQTGGGSWVLHGQYTFAAGTGGWVQVSDINGQAAADAARFVAAGPALPTVTITATTPTAQEAGTVPGAFTVTRTGATTAALTVSYTVGGTATPGADYATLGGSVVIPVGQASAPITVTPVDDSAVEPDETVVVTLAAGAGYVVGNPAAATVTIVSDDVGGCPPELIIDNLGAGQSGASGPGTVSFTGTWAVSSATGQFGTSSLYSSGTGLDTYTWKTAVLNPGQACTYQVYVWWTQHANRSTNVPITVSEQTGGAVTKTFNEQAGGGQWQLHGTYTFPAGAQATVQATDANGQAAADAARFVLGAADTTPPAPVTNLQVADPGTGGQLNVSWTNPGDGDLAGVLVLRQPGSPVADAPVAGQSYSAGQTVGGSTVAFAAAGTGFADTGLTNATTYHYKAFAYDGARNYAAGVAQSGTPTGPAVACASELIVDNLGVGQSGASGPGTVSFTGTWAVSSATGQFGSNSLYSNGTGLDTYTWKTAVLNPGQACTYQVFVWWTQHVNRSTSVPITVSGQTGGAVTKTFNEQAGGGQWQSHGTYTFPAGAQGTVQVTDANGQAAADAARFVLVP